MRGAVCCTAADGEYVVASGIINVPVTEWDLMDDTCRLPPLSGRPVDPGERERAT